MKQRPATHTGKLATLTMRFVTAIGLISVSLSTGAQQLTETLVYGPASNGGAGPGAVTPTAIPTLGGTGLVLLSALLLFIFWRLYRKGSIQGARFLAVTLISGALASGVGGIKLVSDAVAQTLWAITPMENAEGGSLELTGTFGDLKCVANATGVTQEVRAMSLHLHGAPANRVSETECKRSESEPHPSPGCAEGTTLEPGEMCGVGFSATASDARLKEDIVPVGVHESGLGLYEFRYLGETKRYRGVMAQEVLHHTPEAVVVMPNGYYAVNYRMLGLEMIEVR